MGYDLVESNIKDRTYKYGVFGNVGFDKANNLGKTNALDLVYMEHLRIIIGM
ncbi:Uncharacterised protein [Streptobacillus moniliformis]|nr:Uncharacterised protein [Streptobacillus moniliformis]